MRITDIQNRQIEWNDVPFADEDPEKARPYEIMIGDILFARTGATVGKSHLIKTVLEPSVFASYLIRVRSQKDILFPEFAAWYFQSPGYWEQITQGAKGTGQPNFNGSKLAALSLPIPPPPEQRRIVTKLNALTARLAIARADLDRVLKLIHRIKQHALITCFSEMAGDQSQLGSLLHGIESGKNMRCEERPPHAGELGVVKVSAVTWGRFDSSQSKTLPPNYNPPEKARIRAGDLLISRANTLELVGAVVIVDDQPDGLFLSDKILRLIVEDEAKAWILWFLRSPRGRKQIEELATGNQLSMRNISQDALRSIRLPFPDSKTRFRLMKDLEVTFARADRVVGEAGRARKLLDRLESAVLAKAFRGALVPQVPTYELANILLERIRAQRSSVPSKRRQLVRDSASV